jgi:hypothetical protein
MPRTKSRSVNIREDKAYSWRYYLQKINLRQFLVREVRGEEPSKEDRIVRTFERPEKACDYAVNIVQRHLDEKCGRGTCKGMFV